MYVYIIYIVVYVYSCIWYIYIYICKYVCIYIYMYPQYISIYWILKSHSIIHQRRKRISLRTWMFSASSGGMLGLSREPQWSLTASTNLSGLSDGKRLKTCCSCEEIGENHCKTWEIMRKTMWKHHLCSFLETYFGIFWGDLYMIVC